MQGSTPNKPEVKVEPGQGAGAQGLLATVAPAPADKKHRALQCVRELRWRCSGPAFSDLQNHLLLLRDKRAQLK